MEERKNTTERTFEERSRMVGRDKKHGAGGMKLPCRITFKATENVPAKENVEGGIIQGETNRKDE